MAFVYRYREENGIIRYVGMTRGERLADLRSRLRDHKKERAFQGKSWRIDYIGGLTVTDAKLLEAHFIAEYANTLFNEAKREMGRISLKISCFPAWTETPPWDVPWYDYLQAKRSEAPPPPAPVVKTPVPIPAVGSLDRPLLLSIRETARLGILPEHALRAGVKRGWVPGFYTGSKFLVNVTRLIDYLNGKETEVP